MLKVKNLLLPAAWISSGDSYKFNIDSDEQGIDCGSISSEIDVPGKPGNLKKRFAALPFAGKRIKLAGFCRCENVQKRAGLFVRTEKLNGRPLTSDDMVDRPLVGTTHWRLCEMIIDVPPEAASIAIGAHLWGKDRYGSRTCRLKTSMKHVRQPISMQLVAWDCGIWNRSISISARMSSFLGEKHFRTFLNPGDGSLVGMKASRRMR